MTQPDDRMVTRLTPPPQARNTGTAAPMVSSRPGFLIEVFAEDGTVLLRLREERGLLVIEGDESRWDEAAKRFLHSMMQWSGLVGIRWKDEVEAAVR